MSSTFNSSVDTLIAWYQRSDWTQPAKTIAAKQVGTARISLIVDNRYQQKIIFRAQYASFDQVDYLIFKVREAQLAAMIIEEHTFSYACRTLPDTCYKKLKIGEEIWEVYEGRPAPAARSVIVGWRAMKVLEHPFYCDEFPKTNARENAVEELYVERIALSLNGRT